MKKPLYILKIGGSIITDKNQMLTPKPEEIKRIVSEILQAKKEKDFNLIFTNGAGSFGHAPVKQYGVREGIKDEKTRLGVTLVHDHVQDLQARIAKEFLKQGEPVIPIHPISFIMQEDEVLKEFPTKQIKKMLEHDLTPIVYGDMVIDSKRGASILSGDVIVPILARELKADKVFIGTDTDGIYDKNPHSNPDAKQIPEINKDNVEEVKKYAEESLSTDVTGGMKKKLESLLEINTESDCVIFNAKTPGNITRALKGERIGSIVKGVH